MTISVTLLDLDALEGRTAQGSRLVDLHSETCIGDVDDSVLRAIYEHDVS